MGANDQRDDADTPAQRANPVVPGRDVAPPAAVGDVEDAVAEEVDGELTEWAPADRRPTDLPPASDAGEEEPGGSA